MKIDWLESELFLNEGRPLRVTGARGVRVRCLKGKVWVTTSGQLEDIFLLGGQCHEIADVGLTLIEGVGEAQIRFERAGAVLIGTPWWKRLSDGSARVLRECAELVSRTGRVASGRDSPA